MVVVVLRLFGVVTLQIQAVLPRSHIVLLVAVCRVVDVDLREVGVRPLHIQEGLGLFPRLHLRDV